MSIMCSIDKAYRGPNEFLNLMLGTGCAYRRDFIKWPFTQIMYRTRSSVMCLFCCLKFYLTFCWTWLLGSCMYDTSVLFIVGKTLLFLVEFDYLKLWSVFLGRDLYSVFEVACVFISQKTISWLIIFSFRFCCLEITKFSVSYCLHV